MQPGTLHCGPYFMMLLHLDDLMVKSLNQVFSKGCNHAMKSQCIYVRRLFSVESNSIGKDIQNSQGVKLLEISLNLGHSS